MPSAPMTADNINFDIVTTETFWAIMWEIEQQQLMLLPNLIPSKMLDFYKQNESLYRSITDVQQEWTAEWELEDLVGSGAFGQVHRVRRNSQDVAALKIISKAEILSNPTICSIFEEKLILLDQSQSGWWPKLLGAFQDGQNLYILMDLIEGVTLEDLLTRHFDRQEGEEVEGLAEPIVQYLAAQAVMALAALHEAGFVHRDVKPGNFILCEGTLQLKLIDFGSAAHLIKCSCQSDGDCLGTTCKRVHGNCAVGTPDYMAPEVLESQNCRSGRYYGAGCDWWSLGILIYELLVGEPPFYSGLLVTTYHRIENHKEFLKLQQDCLSADARDLLARLLCKEEDRLDFQRIKTHTFFRAIDWDTLGKEPPFELVSAYLLELFGCFDLHIEDDARKNSEASFKRKITPKKGFEGSQLPFVGFTNRSYFKQNVTNDVLTVNQSTDELQIEQSKKIQQLEGQLVFEKGKTAELVRKLAQVMQATMVTGTKTTTVKADSRIRAAEDRAIKAEARLKAEIIARERLQEDLVACQKTIEELTSFLSTNNHHKRETSTVTTIGSKFGGSSIFGGSPRKVDLGIKQMSTFEGWVRVWDRSDGSDKKSTFLHRLKGKNDLTKKVFLQLRGPVLCMGDSEKTLDVLVDFRTQATWIQAVLATEIVKNDKKLADCMFKIRTAINHSRTISRKSSTIHSLKPASMDPMTREKILEALRKEERIRDGAVMLAQASVSTSDSSRMAQSHIQASMRKIEQLAQELARLDTMEKEDSMSPGVEADGGGCHSEVSSLLLADDGHAFEVMQFEPGQSPKPCQVCIALIWPLQTQVSTSPWLRCRDCGMDCHRDCSEIVTVNCSDAQALETAMPVYFQTSSKEDSRRWIFMLEHARKVSCINNR